MIYQCSTPNIARLIVLKKIFKYLINFTLVAFPPRGLNCQNKLCQVAKTAVFEAMMGSSLYCMSLIMSFLAHLAIGHFTIRFRLSLAFHILVFSSENTEPI